MHFQSIRMFVDGAGPALGNVAVPGEQAAVGADSSEAPLAVQVNQGEGRGRIKFREAAHLELSNADGPNPCLLPEGLDEGAK
jgi:hypothetical protein